MAKWLEQWTYNLEAWSSSSTLATSSICSRQSRVQILGQACKIANWFTLYQFGFSLCYVPCELFVLLSLSKRHHKALFEYRIVCIYVLCTWVFYSTLLPSELIHIANIYNFKTSNGLLMKFACLGHLIGMYTVIYQLRSKVQYSDSVYGNLL